MTAAAVAVGAAHVNCSPDRVFRMGTSATNAGEDLRSSVRAVRDIRYKVGLSNKQSVMQSYCYYTTTKPE